MLTIYTASKAALAIMTEAMRPEVAKYGVDMVMVNPGDLPSETKLCTGQEAYYDKIEKDMGEVGRGLMFFAGNHLYDLSCHRHSIY